jgi:hypothetical protein
MRNELWEPISRNIDRLSIRVIALLINKQLAIDKTQFDFRAMFQSDFVHVHPFRGVRVSSILQGRTETSRHYPILTCPHFVHSQSPVCAPLIRSFR